ncbi:hypothetical protein CORC01_05288 [Colletotrichum orchidophilum]|uniref:Zn(2)-C6 fungal-type domain-containing protein n=1 Tax=Colletotrichum orchidophilum TaxID=1209926 RepID=A0A1G4BDR1_9PEZI|nr:uncharacterized protein CORC01_05288 [Colletotrichum orchidophilum]OHE99488.1 hypothetical protein CORC01_05288 [Colletotrichum orchidophilum]
MARKGCKKTKTGCLTCKIRKIKCDETKPSCRCCNDTGRKCDGYTVQASLESKIRSDLGRHGSNSASERRALQYFYEYAAPRLSGPRRPVFWTHFVMQLSESEPIVKHSLLAISHLYEAREIQSTPSIRPSLALQYYNASIKGLKAVEDQSLVLVVCILFTCIELLLSNNETAIQHCNHGLAILENYNNDNPWILEHLLPIFRRLSVLPLLIGKPLADSAFAPVLRPVVPTRFESIEDAQSMLDDIFKQLMLLRHWKQKGTHFDVVKERSCIDSLLHQCKELIQNLDIDSTSQADCASAGPQALMQMRFQLCQVCFDMVFPEDQADSNEKNIHDFRKMITQASAFNKLRTIRVPRFVFELAFSPILSFIVMECKCLELRLAALRLIRVLGAERESLFESHNLYTLGRQRIQTEHGVILDIADCPQDFILDSDLYSLI